LLLGLAAGLATHADAGTIERISVSSGQYQLQGSLCIPAGKGPFPAVVYHHGGLGRRIGGAPEDTCSALAANSFVGIALIRRPTRPLTGHLDDANAAVDYVKKLPGVDPQRIGVIGFSRGALLTWQQAAGRRDLSAVVIMAPAVNSALSLKDASRINVPVFVLVAENDTGSKYTRNRDTLRFTQRLIGALEQAGRDVRTIIYPAYQPEGHSLFFKVRKQYWTDVIRFLKSTL
jgi:acetyl esterase/lipase